MNRLVEPALTAASVHEATKWNGSIEAARRSGMAGMLNSIYGEQSACAPTARIRGDAKRVAADLQIFGVAKKGPRADSASRPGGG